MKNKVKEYRESQGLTKTFLAEQVGITSQFLANIENQKQIPNVKTALKLSQILVIDIYTLFS